MPRFMLKFFTYQRGAFNLKCSVTDIYWFPYTRVSYVYVVRRELCRQSLVKQMSNSAFPVFRLKMKVLSEIHYSLLIGLVYVCSKNFSSATNTTVTNCPNASIVEYIHDQGQLDNFFQRMVSYDTQTVMCLQLSLTGNKFTLDIVQLMKINTTKLIVLGEGIVNVDCTAESADLNTLKNIVRPISGALLVLFDGLTFNSCPVPILIEDVAVVMILNCIFL